MLQNHNAEKDGVAVGASVSISKSDNAMFMFICLEIYILFITFHSHYDRQE